MSPRLTDWSIALAALLAFTTGVVSLVSGLPQDWTIFMVHGIAGLWLLLLLWGKLRRVWPRLIHPRRWDRRTVYGLLALLLVTVTLGAGIWWAAGGDLYFAGFNLLNWHIAMGLAITAAIMLHMLARAKRLRKRDIAGRRQALYFSAAPGRRGALARTAAHPTYLESAWRQTALHRLARDGQLRRERLPHHKLGCRSAASPGCADLAALAWRRRHYAPRLLLRRTGCGG